MIRASKFGSVLCFVFFLFIIAMSEFDIKVLFLRVIFCCVAVQGISYFVNVFSVLFFVYQTDKRFWNKIYVEFPFDVFLCVVCGIENILFFFIFFCVFAMLRMSDHAISFFIGTLQS